MPEILGPQGPGLAAEVIGRLDRRRRPDAAAGQWRAEGQHSRRHRRVLLEGRHSLCHHPEWARVVPETHPLSLGVLGLFGDGRAEEYLFDTPCDLLIAVGVSFDGLVTRSFSPRWSRLQADVIHVDPDPSAFGRFVATSLGITATARDFLRSLNSVSLQHLSVAVPPRVAPAIPETEPEVIHPLEVMREMDSLLPTNATLCTDSGTCIFWAFQGIPVRRAGTFFSTIDFAPMGCGVVGAIGVALARPEERVICIAGDGAFLMHGTEVSTAVAQGIPVTWIILNDGQLSATIAPIRGRMDPSAVASIGATDLAAMARSLGAQGIRVDKRSELRAGLEAALAADRSLRPGYRHRSGDQQTRDWRGQVSHSANSSRHTGRQESIQDPARARADPLPKT